MMWNCIELGELGKALLREGYTRVTKCSECTFYREFDTRQDEEKFGYCELLHHKSGIPVTVYPVDYCSFATKGKMPK